MNLTISMAALALAASISPGPVNVVALSSGAQFGLAASLLLPKPSPSHPVPRCSSPPPPLILSKSSRAC